MDIANSACDGDYRSQLHVAVACKCCEQCSMDDVLEGYHGDTSKMFMVGNVSEKAQDLCRVTKHALDEAIKVCGPGVPIREIGKVGCTSVKKWLVDCQIFVIAYPVWCWLPLMQGRHSLAVVYMPSAALWSSRQHLMGDAWKP